MRKNTEIRRLDRIAQTNVETVSKSIKTML